jgi:hypothetical protein
MQRFHVEEDTLSTIEVSSKEGGLISKSGDIFNASNFKHPLTTVPFAAMATLPGFKRQHKWATRERIGICEHSESGTQRDIGRPAQFTKLAPISCPSRQTTRQARFSATPSPEMKSIKSLGTSTPSTCKRTPPSEISVRRQSRDEPWAQQ